LGIQIYMAYLIFKYNIDELEALAKIRFTYSRADPPLEILLSLKAYVAEIRGN